MWPTIIIIYILFAHPSEPGFSSGLLVKVIDTGFQDCFVDSAFSLIWNHIHKPFLYSHCLDYFLNTLLGP